MSELQKVAARRLLQLGVSRAWRTWSEQAEGVWRCRRACRMLAGRLLRPMLWRCLSHWKHDWSLCVMSSLEALARSASYSDGDARLLMVGSATLHTAAVALGRAAEEEEDGVSNDA